MLDEFLPRYDFSERHETFVAATPEATLVAARKLAPRDVPLLLVLLTIRSVPHLISRRRLMIAPDGAIVEQVVRLGFVVLADRPREHVVGVVGKFWRPDSGLLPVQAEEFAGFSEPGFAKAVVDFRTEPSGDGCVLSTETRIQSTDESARRKFGLYWRVIVPGSAAIRRAWLRAIKRRAEGR